MQKIVKAQSLLMVFVLLIMTVFSASFVKTQAATITTAYIEGENIRVRETPSTKNDDNILDRISNTSANVLGSTKDSSGNLWYKISYRQDGEVKTGYIFYDSTYIRIVTYNPDADFETQISSFPESYRDSLRKLHAQYPNWKFIPDPVGKAFNSAVAEQMTNNRKLVQLNSKVQPISWRSMGLGAYDWNKEEWTNVEGGWTGASREVIAYYMDPRNFLNSDEIYMFLEQSYNAAVQNREGVKKIIEGTFLAKPYTAYVDKENSKNNEPGGGSYLEAIMLAAEKSGVSPYVIAAKIKQEHAGNGGTSALITGTYSGYNGIYKGYYNFFNIKATGNTDADIIKNGLAYAKLENKTKEAWNTRYKSILGGARFLAENYIDRGQNTCYYQDFNVHNGGTHQYAQAVHDAYNQGLSLAKTYQEHKDISLSFIIPVYTDMPGASPMPAKSDKRNNYYLSEITVEGLTPSFGMYTHSYNLAVSGDTTVKVNAVSGAVIVANSSIPLKAGENEVTILARAETGYRNKYIIHVNASKACTLYIKSGGAAMEAPTASDSSSSNNSGSSSNTSSGTSSNPLEQMVMLGDTNSDGKITIIDLAKVQMHILKVKSLSGDSLKAGDVNKDGKISIVDLAKIQMHILKVKIIEQ